MKIKEILDYLKDFIEEDRLEQINLNRWFISSLLDYITNLQEKSNNQAEEINRLYKQREKFMKKYGYLKEENERLKEDKKKVLELIENDYFEDGSFENEYIVKNILNGGDE